MSRDGSISLTWGDGEHRFRLAIGQLRELQEKCDAGPAEIAGRLADGRWRVNDVRETVRLGLVGGGMAPGDAHKLTTRYVDERPWLESVPAAQAVLMAALVGVPEEPVGKDQAAEAETEAPTDASPSPLSTAPAP
jgi:hypothetical protein